METPTAKDGAKDFFRVILAVFLPPLAVVSQVGLGGQLIFNLLLGAAQLAGTIGLVYADAQGLLPFAWWHIPLVPVMWLPALLHAIWVISARNDQNQAVPGGFKTFVSLVIAVILPPAGVLIKRGMGGALVVNVILWLAGCVPGQIHAAWVITRDQ